MDTIFSDTIAIESFDAQNFRTQALETLQEFKNIQNLLQIEASETLEIRNREMATVTLYKDLFRVQLEKLLQKLLSKEISKLSSGVDKDMLSEVSLDNITNFLENDIYLDETSISNELKNIILNVLNKINYIVGNWEFLVSKSEDFKNYSIGYIQNEMEFMLTDNISTFLGENIKLAESFLEEAIQSDKFSENEVNEMKLLIKQNGLRKIEFGYELDFEKLKYLIYSALRCRDQIANEREDVELFNLLTILITYFSTNSGINKILEDIRAVYKNRPEVLSNLDDLTSLNIKPKFLIENSPPDL